jgi:hypothetical protein
MSQKCEICKNLAEESTATGTKYKCSEYNIDPDTLWTKVQVGAKPVGCVKFEDREEKGG